MQRRTFYEKETTRSHQRHLEQLLCRIRDDLNPQGFSIAEIREEGFYGTPSDGKYEPPKLIEKPESLESALRKMRKLGWIERSENDHGLFQVTELGMEIKVELKVLK